MICIAVQYITAFDAHTRVLYCAICVHYDKGICMVRVCATVLCCVTSSLSAMQCVRHVGASSCISHKARAVRHHRSYDNVRGRVVANYDDVRTSLHAGQQQILDYIPHQIASESRLYTPEYETHLHKQIEECHDVKRISRMLSGGSFVGGVASFLVGVHDISPEVNVAAACVCVASLVTFPGSMLAHGEASGDERCIKEQLHDVRAFRKSLDQIQLHMNNHDNQMHEERSITSQSNCDRANTNTT